MCASRTLVIIVDLGGYKFKYWPFVYSVPRYYLNQLWYTISKDPENDIKWNPLSKSRYIHI